MKKIKKALIGMLGFSLALSCVACSSGTSSPEIEDPNVKPQKPEDSKNVTYPEFEPIGGFYKEKQNVKITCEGAVDIYYTILKRGESEEEWKANVAASKPTTESTKYTGPFEVSEECIIRAMAVKEDGTKNYAMTCFDFDLDRSTDFVNVGGTMTPTNPESINWQDQIIYFILTDRFFDGDSSNNKIAGLTDNKGNVYDESLVLSGQPASGYNGGDIKGITQKLQYIKDAGFTAIWMTPPVKCQIAESNYHGYHGYWASDFTEVDPHMGTLEDYQNFVKAAHDLGLYVIQDIVVNHTGDYQQISEDITKEMLAEGNISYDRFHLEEKSVPLTHPEQLPWALNDINDLTVDEFTNNAFFHYNAGISDYTNQTAMYTGQSSNLDDIATENPVVRNLLRGYFRYWIDKCGIDGYRIDTALYVEPDFFEDFINSTEPGNEGVRVYGKSLGKNDFIDFGEAFSQSESICGSYTKSSDGTQRMDSMLYFPLRYAIADTVSSGSKTSTITNILEARYTQQLYNDPNRLVTFIDNHDMDRIGQTLKGNTELIKTCYNLIFSIPGIPQVYYGSEQGFSGQCRAGMFAGSFLDEGRTQTEDQFDTENEWYKYFQALTKMRKENRVFRYNTIKVLQDTKDSAGIFAFLIREKDESGNTISTGDAGTKALFVMNTASNDKILDSYYKYLGIGEKYELVNYNVHACSSAGTQLTTSFVTTGYINQGKVQMVVPGNSCAIYILKEKGITSGEDGANLSITQVPRETITGEDGNNIQIKGKSSVSGNLNIILNGDYSLSTVVEATADEEFTADIDVSSYSNGTISVQLVQYYNENPYFSSTSTFEILRPLKLICSVSDPLGDDNGVGVAKGKLSVPTDEQFSGSMDIAGVDVYRSGNDIRLGIKMKNISDVWNPTSNLFDHMVLYVFISDGDDSTGCEYHSRSNYKLPENFGKYDYMFQANGWGQSYYSAKGATKDAFGNAVTPAPSNSPKVKWDKDGCIDGKHYLEIDWSDYSHQIGDVWSDDKPGMIWINISAASMGYPSDITGYKFYINTWDFDMGSPRGIKEGEATVYKFGTTLSVDETPRVADELDNIIVIQ